MDKISVKNKRTDDFGTMAGDFIGGINFKVAFMLFFVYLIIHSDMFNAKLVSRWGGTPADNPLVTNTKGTLATGVITVLAYVVLDSVSKFNQL